MTSTPSGLHSAHSASVKIRLKAFDAVYAASVAAYRSPERHRTTAARAAGRGAGSVSLRVGVEISPHGGGSELGTIPYGDQGQLFSRHGKWRNIPSAGGQPVAVTA